jgi:membrane-associated phospholipid phosphatase
MWSKAKIMRCWPVVPGVLFVLLALLVASGWTGQFDTSFLSWLQQYRTTWLTSVMLIITAAGDSWTMLVVSLVISLAMLRMRFGVQKALLPFLLVAGANGVAALCKQIFQRPRPGAGQLLYEHSYSFPSAHAMASAALALALIYITWPSRWRWWALAAGGVFVGLVGFSRLYLGVHYPTDVLAGWCLSCLWFGLVVYFVTKRSQTKA